MQPTNDTWSVPRETVREKPSLNPNSMWSNLIDDIRGRTVAVDHHRKLP